MAVALPVLSGVVRPSLSVPALAGAVSILTEHSSDSLDDTSLISLVR